MNYKGYNLFPIGIGTWGIGGFASKDTTNDNKQIDALIYLLEHGLNYISICHWYAKGHATENLAKAITESRTKRKTLFINQSIYSHNNKSVEDIESERKKFFDTLKLDYVDSLQLDFGVFQKYNYFEVIDYLKNLLSNKLIKYVNITNTNLEFLKKFYEEFSRDIFACESGFNFEIRENYDNGVLPFCTSHDVLNVIYQPIRRNRTAKRNWKLLVELATKYGVTQNQIILKWIISNGYLPLVKSENIEHINENIKALDIELEEKDVKKLNEFRVANYKQPKIDWGYDKEGIPIYMLSNVFDEEYDRQVKN